MHKTFLPIVATMLFVFSTFFAQDSHAQSDKIPSITVTGTSTITLRPDELLIYITIRHESKKGKEAVEAYRNSRVQLMEMLKKYAIADSTITESGMRFGKFSEWLDNVRREEKFYAESTVQATVYDFEKYPDLAIALTEIPGINLDGSSYQSSRTIEVRHTARLQALAEARKKAEAMAAVYGAKLGKTLHIIENSGNSIFNPYSNTIGMYGEGYDRVSESGLIVSDSFIEVTASVSVEFELEE